MKSTDGESAIVEYTHRIDFVAGYCWADVKGAPRVIFQAYCGGSGCKDLDNWGIVDPETLQVLLTPRDSNSAEVRRILGMEPERPKKMLSVRKEAERLGMAVP